MDKNGILILGAAALGVVIWGWRRGWFRGPAGADTPGGISTTIIDPETGEALPWAAPER